MRTNDKTLTLVVLALLAVAWCCYLFAPADKPAAPGRSGNEAADPFATRSATRSDPVPTAAGPSPIRVELPTNAIVVAVQDELGEPIPGAVVARCSAAGARNLSLSDQIGTTDSSGEILIGVAQSRSKRDHGLLAFHAKGFVPASIEEPRDPGRYEVRMAAGSTIEIECRDFAGRHIPEVNVAISMIPFFGSIAAAESSTQPGTDAATTIRHGRSDRSGVVVFEGLLPGRYFVRAESRDYHLAGTDIEGAKAVLDVDHGRSRHTIVCGEICVAALETNVASSDVLFYEVYEEGPHITVSSAMETLDIRRREIERRFPRCKAIVSLARTDGPELGWATFRYSTISHGEVVQEVPFVRFSAFTSPFVVNFEETSRPPLGAVCVRVQGGFDVERNPLRVLLKRDRSDLSGILCIEGKARVVPAGRYALDTNDRELGPRIVWPKFVDVGEHGTTEIVLELKDGLMPLTVDVKMPAVLKDQVTYLVVSSEGRASRRGATRGGRWRTWVRPGVHDVTARTAGCGSVAARVVVTNEKAAHVTLELTR